MLPNSQIPLWKWNIEEFFYQSRPSGVSQMTIVVKKQPANAADIKDTGSIPGLGRSPGGEHGNPLQYSCLENPMDRGAWKATVHRIYGIQLKRLSMHAHGNSIFNFLRNCQTVFQSDHSILYSNQQCMMRDLLLGSDVPYLLDAGSCLCQVYKWVHLSSVNRDNDSIYFTGL